MASLTQGVLILLACWMLSGHVSGEEFSKQILNFQATWNGVFNNSDQCMVRGKKIDSVRTTFVPVIMSALPGKLITFFEEDVNDRILRLGLLVISGVKDSVINITRYNFKNIDKYKPGEYNISDLSTVRLEDLSPTNESCNVMVQIISDGLYRVHAPVCRRLVNGQHPIIIIKVSCDTHVVTLPQQGADEKIDVVPYIMKRQGKTFPVPGAPNDFVGPCDKGR